MAQEETTLDVLRRGGVPYLTNLAKLSALELKLTTVENLNKLLLI